MPRKQQPIPQKKRIAAAKSATGKAAMPANRKLPPLAEGEKRVLYLGWHSANGKLPTDFAGPEWRLLRVDLDPAMKPDIVAAPYDLNIFPDRSVDAVWLPQLLQRFAPHHVVQALQECRRILKDGGMFGCSVPNAQLAATYVATDQSTIALYTTPYGPITPVDLLWGLRVGQRAGDPWHHHRTGFTPEMFGMMLRDEGFSHVTVTPKGYELILVAKQYGAEHPQRVERVTMGKSEMLGKAPTVSAAVPESAILTAARPRMKADGSGRPDELDLPPVIWKPLGLKH